jgi:hypothetical protein
MSFWSASRADWTEAGSLAVVVAVAAEVDPPAAAVGVDEVVVAGVAEAFVELVVGAGAAPEVSGVRAVAGGAGNIQLSRLFCTTGAFEAAVAAVLVVTADPQAPSWIPGRATALRGCTTWLSSCRSSSGSQESRAFAAARRRASRAVSVLIPKRLMS